MFKINLQEHTLYLADDVCSFHLDSIGKKRAVTYRYSKKSQLREIVALMPEFDIKNHIIYHDKPEELLDNLFSIYKKVEAAGGLVVNERGQILFIFRNGKWDLPKGKMEENETQELCAVREVEEECGLKVSKLNQHLITTYHSYNHNGKTVLKANYWYMMEANSQQKIQPQEAEGIDAVVWKSLSEIDECLENSYDSIKDVIKQYRDSVLK